jgi:hypothetical protein
MLYCTMLYSNYERGGYAVLCCVVQRCTETREEGAYSVIMLIHAYTS